MKILRIALVCGAALLQSHGARAEPVGIATPSVVSARTPRGVATMGRVDGARSGRTSHPFPKTPVELWRKTVGPIDQLPVVDEAGDVVIALPSGEIVKIGASGQEVFRFRSGVGGAVTPPLLGEGGTASVISSSGTHLRLSAKGTVLSTTLLPLRGATISAAPLLTGGRAIVIAGSTALELDAAGNVLSQARLPLTSSNQPIDHPSGPLVVLNDGAVYRLRSPNEPLKVGAFGMGVQSGVALVGSRTLISATQNLVLALDLVTGITSTRASLSTGAFVDGPVAVGEKGETVFSTTDGYLLAYDASGIEVMRSLIDKAAQVSVGATPPPAFMPRGPAWQPPVAVRQSPAVLLGSGLEAAFLRASGRFGLSRSPTDTGPGPVEVVSERLCNNPVAVLPAGPRRLLAVCGEGLLVLFGDN